MQFNIKVQNDFKNNIRREWALTNGLGGYAGGSVTGAINRTHQGYLIASLHAPVQRYVCFSKTNEKIVTDSHTYDLSSDQFKGRMPHRRHPIYKRFHIRWNHMLYI